MKNFRLFLASLVLALCFTACEQEPEGVTPTINLSQTEVTIDADGTSLIVGYAITNGEGGTLSAACDAEWLTIDTATANRLTLSATANDTAAERTTNVVLSYAGAKDVTLKVTQAYATAAETLSMKITEVGSTTITFDVSAPDDMQWIPMVTYTEYWDESLSDQEIFESDMEYFEYMAEKYEVTLDTFLSEIVGTGSESGIVIDELDPETGYVIYVYGITAEGELATEIVWEAATTEPPYEGDITFEFTTDEYDFQLDFCVIPSIAGVNYYHGIATEAEINAWKELAGSDDLRAAIQAGDIEPNIERYMNLGFIEERYEYFEMYNESGTMDYGWEELTAATKYIIYAAKWNENCELVGEVSTYEHTSATVEMSENVVTLTIAEVTQSSVTVETEASLNDPYAMIPVRSSEIEGLSDSEIVAYISEAYDYLLSEYIFYGSAEKTYRKMRPETEYTLLWFGYYGGTQTTELWKQTFTTLASGDPAECTFEIYVEPDTDSAWVEIDPSDKGHFYHWTAYPADYTAEDVKEYIQYVIDNYYEGDIAAFSSWELSQGYCTETAWDLTPATEYKIGVVIMDYDSGAYLSDVIFGETFATSEVTYADITINVEWDKYYDIDALIAAGYTQYEEGAGKALLPVKVTTEGECSEFYYDIYNNDLSDTETYTDEIFYEGLWYGAWFEQTSFAVPYDTPVTLVAVAYDNAYDPCRLYREVIVLTKDGASPVEDYEAATTAAKMSSTPSLGAKVATKRHAEKQTLSASQIEAKQKSAKANVLAARTAKIEKRIEHRKAHTTTSNRFVAR